MGSLNTDQIRAANDGGAAESQYAGLPPLTQEHLRKLASFYDQHNLRSNWAARGYRKVLARYYRHAIPAEASVLEIGCGHGELLRHLPNRRICGVDVSPAQVEHCRASLPHGRFFVQSGENLQIEESFDVIILSDTINESADVQALLTSIRRCARPETRLILNFDNNLWHPLLSLFSWCGLRSRRPSANWLASADVRNLLHLADWEIVTACHRVLCPADLGWVERLANALLAPFLPWFCLTIFMVARMRPAPAGEGVGGSLAGDLGAAGAVGAGKTGVSGADPQNLPSVSVIVPARNEAGNIAAAVQRCPRMGSFTELIFIEGHSQDATWEVIQETIAAYRRESGEPPASQTPFALSQTGAGLRLRALRQSGKGKGNAVREAFAAAQGDVLMILDADLTMPPEELPKYYEALVSGRAEFVNGVRLVYPMEEEAMRFLNMCGNKFFSLLFSWLLAQSIKDTLCGTKVLYRKDYAKIAANRSFFGDFDPFGDFDLLFGAAKLNLKIADLPIRYRSRSYGETNISRFKHGLILLRMASYASRKLKFV